MRWYHREIESISSKILTEHTLTCYQESGYLFREGKKLGHKSRETGEFPKSGMPRWDLETYWNCGFGLKRMHTQWPSTFWEAISVQIWIKKVKMFRKLQVCEKTISLERQKGKWLRRGWFILTAPPPSVYSPNANINIFCLSTRTLNRKQLLAN